MAVGLADQTQVPTSGDDAPHRPLDRRLPLAAAVLLGVLVPLVYAALSGNLGIPHNDTWAFGRSAQDFARTGHVRMFNWNMMGLAGLVVTAWPVGTSLVAQSVFIAALAVAGLLACYDLLAGVLGPDGRRRAALGTLVVALWPGFTLLSTSFMTDIPAFTAIAGTLAMGRRALDRTSLPWLAGACGLGLWGATIREQVLAAPAAVLAVALFRARFRAYRAPTFRIRHILTAGGLLLAAIGLFELWRRGVPGGGAPDFTVRKATVGLVFGELVEGLLCVTLAVSPVVVAVVRPRQWSRGGWIAAGVTLAAALLAISGRGAFLGNYVDHRGAYESAGVQGRPVLIGGAWWLALAAVAAVSASLLVGTVVDRVRRQGWGLGMRPEILLFAVATTLGTALEVGQGRDIYDRYLIPMAIPALVLLLTGPLPVLWRADRPWRPWRLGATAVATTAVVVTGATLTANAFSFDSAMWRTATALVASGQADAGHIEAGLDWDGYHSPAALTDVAEYQVGTGLYGALPYFVNHTPCFVVTPSARPVAGWTLVEVKNYKLYGLFGAGKVYVFRVAASQHC